VVLQGGRVVVYVFDFFSLNVLRLSDVLVSAYWVWRVIFNTKIAEKQVACTAVVQYAQNVFMALAAQLIMVQSILQVRRVS
jgi:hypothetical protein